MTVLIKGGTVVSSTGADPAEVLVDGEVIAAVLQPGSDLAAAAESGAERVIDAMVDPTHPVTGPYAERVDPESIAVTGHSFGGFTAYAMVSGYESAAFPADDRVDAIITLAPFTTPILDDAALSRVDVPALIVVGTDDNGFVRIRSFTFNYTDDIVSRYCWSGEVGFIRCFESCDRL